MCWYHVTFDLDLEHTLDAQTILCKFGGNPAICLVEEAICAKSLQTDGRTDRQTDGRCAIALAHWNELRNCWRLQFAGGLPTNPQFQATVGMMIQHCQ